MKTLEQLKEEGVEVRFTHMRRARDGEFVHPYDMRQNRLQPLPTGGFTLARVNLPDGEQIVGVAECSQRDNFCKKIGRDIALGRALKQLEKAQQQKRESAPWAIEMGPQVGVLRDVQRLS